MSRPVRALFRDPLTPDPEVSRARKSIQRSQPHSRRAYRVDQLYADAAFWLTDYPTLAVPALRRLACVSLTQADLEASFWGRGS